MCAAFAQPGQFPTLAFWVKFCIDPSCPFAIESFEMRRTGSAPPPGSDSPSRRSPIMHRRAWRAESQTDRLREEVQVLLSTRPCGGQGACVRVEPDGWLPLRLH